MSSIQKLYGKRIKNILRLDFEVDYEFYSPIAVIFKIVGESMNFVISIASDNSSVEFDFFKDNTMNQRFGIDYSETMLNELKSEDDLNLFTNNIIKSIYLAEYIQPKMKGDDFIIHQGKYAGIKIVTDKNALQFINNEGGWIEINDDINELPLSERWKWK